MSENKPSDSWNIPPVPKDPHQSAGAGEGWKPPPVDVARNDTYKSDIQKRSFRSLLTPLILIALLAIALVVAANWQQLVGNSVAAEKDYNSALEYVYGMNKVQIDNVKAAELLRRAANKHLPEAEAQLASWTKTCGPGIARDNAKAIEFGKSALADGLIARSDAGRASAQEALALIYEQGIGVGKDLTKAIELHQRAADQGDAVAQFRLGIIYDEGTGVSRDTNKAISLLKQAADAGVAHAQAYIGRAYEPNLPISPSQVSRLQIANDESKAELYFRKAANQGAPFAFLLLARRAAESASAQEIQPTPHDRPDKSLWEQKMEQKKSSDDAGKAAAKPFIDKAVELYAKAADQGDPLAQVALFWLNLDPERDPHKGEELFRKAADQGVIIAQLLLVQAYSSKDLDLAAQWGRKAGDQGPDEAWESERRVEIQSGLGTQQTKETFEKMFEDIQKMYR